VVGLTTSYPLAALAGVLVVGLVLSISLIPNGGPTKRIMVLGSLSVLLVFGSLLLPTSIPGRSASERLEHGLPFPFIQHKLMGYGFMAEGPSAHTGPALAPQEFPTALSEATLLADIVIVGVGLWLLEAYGADAEGARLPAVRLIRAVRLLERQPCHQRAIHSSLDRSRAETHGQH
jgi:hypothetical protein